MCGIAGIIQPNNGGYNQRHVKQMTDALAHRGPDGEGFWENAERSALLGHRRLAIIDRSDAAAQPMRRVFDEITDRDPFGLTIVHNGEIYNYIELREELIKQGYRFHTQSDTEVILAAYHLYGDECIEYFDGMFAFAIWDEELNELFAARDRFGEKPFFYTQHNDSFLFASEMKAFWAVGVPKEPNRKMLFNFITIGYTDNPERKEETFFENVYKLPAASRLSFEPGDFEPFIDTYWEIDLTKDNSRMNFEEATAHFDKLFTRSIQRRLRSDVPIGTSLSGGLDSSSILAFLHEQNQHPAAFTATFPGFAKDETAMAASLANNYGSPHHTITVDAGSFADHWEKICYHQEEPFGSASVAAQFAVYGLAKEKGITVLLDGQGADEILAGYHKYYKWYWQELFSRRRLLISRELKAAKTLGVKEEFGWKNMVAALFPDIAMTVLDKQYLSHALTQQDLAPEFVKLQSGEAYYTTPEILNLNGMLHFNTCVHGLEELLRFADRNSMAHGREVRLPFLDHELVEFVFSLPSSFKIKNGYTKWLLRKTVENKLPKAITWRKDKTGFEPPQQQWMNDRSIQALIQEAKEILVDQTILKPEVLKKPVTPAEAYAKDNFDWRYLSAGFFMKQ